MGIIFGAGSSGFPLIPSSEDLNLIYGRNNIPKKVNLLDPKGTRRRLSRFTKPFNGSLSSIKIWCSRDLDEPLSDIFEEQLNKYIKDVLEIHWDKSVKIPEGVIIVLKRTGRAGCLYRLGFQPKTENEIEQEKRIEEQNRIRAEKIEAEKDRLRKIALDKYNALDEEDKRFLQMDHDYSRDDKYFSKYFGTWEDYLRFKFGLFTNNNNIKKKMGGKYDSNQLS